MLPLQACVAYRAFFVVVVVVLVVVVVVVFGEGWARANVCVVVYSK